MWQLINSAFQKRNVIIEKACLLWRFPFWKWRYSQDGAWQRQMTLIIKKSHIFVQYISLTSSFPFICFVPSSRSYHHFSEFSVSNPPRSKVVFVDRRLVNWPSDQLNDRQSDKPTNQPNNRSKKWLSNHSLWFWLNSLILVDFVWFWLILVEFCDFGWIQWL